jgi:GNAT superfamily N-acetyltransferase
VRLADKFGREITYRHVRPEDDIDLITGMLHEAYRPLAAQGLRFLATHQDAATTRLRMSRGETILAVDADQIVGTITLKNVENTKGSPFYDRDDVAGFGQLAVRPSHQGSGIGSSLLNLVERRASQKGVKMLALDTSEHATHLIAFYQAKGYSFVEHTQWPEVNYRSMIFAKTL